MSEMMTLFYPPFRDILCLMASQFFLNQHRLGIIHLTCVLSHFIYAQALRDFVQQNKSDFSCVHTNIQEVIVHALYSPLHDVQQLYIIINSIKDTPALKYINLQINTSNTGVYCLMSAHFELNLGIFKPKNS